MYFQLNIPTHTRDVFTTEKRHQEYALQIDVPDSLKVARKELVPQFTEWIPLRYEVPKEFAAFKDYIERLATEYPTEALGALVGWKEVSEDQPYVAEMIDVLMTNTKLTEGSLKLWVVLMSVPNDYIRSYAIEQNKAFQKKLPKLHQHHCSYLVRSLTRTPLISMNMLRSINSLWNCMVLVHTSSVQIA